MKEIDLHNNKGEVIARTMVDDEDYEWLMNYSWSLHTNGGERVTPHISVERSMSKGDTGIKYMHRFIMNKYHDINGHQIDHKDRNPLNNQKNNLRLCTHSENMGNRIKNQVGEYTSQYKGVWRQQNKWLAQVMKDRHAFFLGCFDSEIDAAMAYDIYAKKHFGEFALVNFDYISPEDEQRLSSFVGTKNKKLLTNGKFSSRYKGVSKRPINRFQAEFKVPTINGTKTQNICVFDNEEDAALAVDFYTKNFAPDRCLNFEDSTQEDMDRIRSEIVNRRRDGKLPLEHLFKDYANTKTV